MPRPRRIIERRHLLRRLSRARGRIKVLVAPAGYGKTVVAQQWLGTGEKQASWLHCDALPAGLAAFATALAGALAELAPDCGRGTESWSEPDLDRAYDWFVPRLARWPRNAWLVLDGYHALERIPGAERLVEQLLVATAVNVVIATRRRPRWLTSRHVLHGECFELTQTALALDPAEVAELVGETDPPALVALADGWPVFVECAACAEADYERDELSNYVLRYLSEEVFSALEPTVRDELPLLAIPPVLTPEFLHEILGERVEYVLEELGRAGVTRELECEHSLHPVARAYLTRRGSFDKVKADHASVRRKCLAIYARDGDWESVADIFQRLGVTRRDQELLELALECALPSASASKIEMWVEYMRSAKINNPLTQLAMAELELKRGNHRAAQALAAKLLGELPPGHPIRFRSAILCGEAAHVGDREHEALAFFEEAEREAVLPEQLDRAKAAQLMVAVALESDDAERLLSELTDTAKTAGPLEALRAAGRRLNFALKAGTIGNLAEGRDAEALLTHVNDPLRRCAFRSPYAASLALGGHYGEGLRVARDLVQDSSEAGLKHAVTYGFATAGIALAGLHRFDEALADLDRASVAARRCGDRYGELNAYSATLRVLCQRGLAVSACTMEPPTLEDAVPSMRGEVIGSRGLALACVGRVAEAEDFADRAEQATTGVEAQMLARAIRCVIAVEGHRPNALEATRELCESAFSRGAIDILVTTYRSSTRALDILVRHPETRERAIHAVQRAGDEELLSCLGFALEDLVNPIANLSSREREVYELVCTGSTNREIAKMLFLSEATIKLHVHHIFDKLGVRSRHALVMNAASRRLFQAAPTTNSASSSDDA